MKGRNEMEEMMIALLEHNPQECRKVTAIVHSQEEKGGQTVWIANKKKSDNEYLALANGKFCTAIYNPFSGYFYADDIYGEVKIQG